MGECIVHAKPLAPQFVRTYILVFEIRGRNCGGYSSDGHERYAPLLDMAIRAQLRDVEARSNAAG